MKPTVYIGADHAGFDVKAIIKEHLEMQGYVVEDMGAHTYDPDDDYPQYGAAVAQAVRKHPGSFGVLSCGNAEGIMIVANKFDGIRAGIGYSMAAARTMRQDDNANIISLPSRLEVCDPLPRIVDTFLTTDFTEHERHRRRLQQLHDIEVDE